MRMVFIKTNLIYCSLNTSKPALTYQYITNPIKPNTIIMKGIMQRIPPICVLTQELVFLSFSPMFTLILPKIANDIKRHDDAQTVFYPVNSRLDDVKGVRCCLHLVICIKSGGPLTVIDKPNLKRCFAPRIPAARWRYSRPKAGC